MPAITIELSDEACEAIGRGIAEAIDTPGIVRLITSQLASQQIENDAIESVAIAAAEAAIANVQTARKQKSQFTTRETAKLLGITPHAVTQRRLRGSLQGFRVRGSSTYYFLRTEVERYTGEITGSFEA